MYNVGKPLKRPSMYVRMMILMGVIAIPLIVYDIHQIGLVFYALFGF